MASREVEAFWQRKTEESFDRIERERADKEARWQQLRREDEARKSGKK